jgi:hypothetical protein
MVYWSALDAGASENRLYKFDPSTNVLSLIGSIGGVWDNSREVVGFAIPTDGTIIGGGYNIYRDDELIEENWPDTSYLDMELDCTTDHTWCVSVACLGGGESGKICTWLRSCCVCDPIEPFVIQPKEGMVLFTWEKPDIPGFVGVKITRDGMIIAPLVIDTFYIDYVSVGNHIYCFTGIYDKPECTESAPFCFNVYVEPQCDPVENVTATIIGPAKVRVQWLPVDAYGIVNYSVYRDDEEPPIGTTTQTIFIDEDVPVGPHIYSVVANYNKLGWNCPNSEPTESNEIFIELCMPVVANSLQVTAATVAAITLVWEYDDFDLYPVTFDVYRDYSWIGNADELTYTDEAEEGKPFAEGVVYTYCVQPVYENCQVAPVCTEAYIQPCVPFNVTDLLVEGNQEAKSVKLDWTYDGTDATFTIIRNNKVIETGVTAKTYTDETIEYDVVYKYCVTPVAACPGGGMACNTIVVDSPNVINEDVNGISIYPNPASTHVIIKGATIIQLDVYNAIGQLVETIKSVEGESISKVDVSSYSSGAYIFKLHTADKAVITKPIVVSRY